MQLRIIRHGPIERFVVEEMDLLDPSHLDGWMFSQEAVERRRAALLDTANKKMPPIGREWALSP
jgi:hypothetical protein